MSGDLTIGLIEISNPDNAQNIIQEFKAKISMNDFFQAGELYRRVMTDKDRDNLIRNITSNLCNARKRTELQQTAIF